MAEAPNRIRELREQRNLTQDQLAFLVAVDRKTVHFWETGKKLPHPRNAKLLARRLGVRVEDLDLAPLGPRELAVQQRLSELRQKQAQAIPLSRRELRELQLLQQAQAAMPEPDQAATPSAARQASRGQQR